METFHTRGGDIVMADTKKRLEEENSDLLYFRFYSFSDKNLNSLVVFRKLPDGGRTILNVYYGDEAQELYDKLAN